MVQTLIKEHIIYNIYIYTYHFKRAYPTKSFNAPRTRELQVQSSSQSWRPCRAQSNYTTESQSTEILTWTTLSGPSYTKNRDLRRGHPNSMDSMETGFLQEEHLQTTRSSWYRKILIPEGALEPSQNLMNQLTLTSHC